MSLKIFVKASTVILQVTHQQFIMLYELKEAQIQTQDFIDSHLLFPSPQKFNLRVLSRHNQSRMVVSFTMLMEDRQMLVLEANKESEAGHLLGYTVPYKNKPPFILAKDAELGLNTAS